MNKIILALDTSNLEEAIDITRNWLNKEPTDEYLLRLYDYLIEVNSFQ